MSDKILETQRLYFRKFIHNDASALLPILGDPEVMRFSISGPQTIDEIKETFIDRCLTSYEEKGFGRYALIQKSNGALIGFCGLGYQQVDGESLPEIGYRLAKKYWGQGFATEAALAIKDYAQNVLNLPSFIAIIEPENIQSIRVAQKLDMTFWKATTFYGRNVHIYRIEFIATKMPGTFAAQDEFAQNP